MAKTATQELMEICVLKKTQPEFKYKETGAGGNVVFEVTCTVEINEVSYEESASGNSKKIAKQAVSTQILDKFKLNESSKANEAKLDEDVIGNKVGSLQELCKKNGLGEPKYELEKQLGPSHNPIFVTSCEVGSVKDKGYSKTSKQMSKHIAAYKVYDLIAANLQKKSVTKLLEQADSTEESEESTIKSDQELRQLLLTFQESPIFKEIFLIGKTVAQKHPDNQKPVTEIKEDLERREIIIEELFSGVKEELKFTEKWVLEEKEQIGAEDEIHEEIKRPKMSFSNSLVHTATLEIQFNNKASIPIPTFFSEGLTKHETEVGAKVKFIELLILICMPRTELSSS